MSDEQQGTQEREPMMTASRRMLSGVELRTLATNGGFAVDENTGEKMIQALQGIIDSLEARWAKLQGFGQSPPLSTGATAQFVSAHMVRTATDEKGLLTQLQQAKSELPTYIEAIKLAQRNYRSQDEQTGTTLNTYHAEA
ncbi:hypothetical protein [Amycolatopsis sp.]|uniref:hypothetical protein n=1 Tax=Amycolatopsis sp. TaxID=37632 RepID=UPI002C1F698F|nr:hypothetical protein [Amycolatopsis sp.]HVV08498.1 hypothetical protein [Amycolatopsis sp.]